MLFALVITHVRPPTLYAPHSAKSAHFFAGNIQHLLRLLRRSVPRDGLHANRIRHALATLREQSCRVSLPIPLRQCPADTQQGRRVRRRDSRRARPARAKLAVIPHHTRRGAREALVARHTGEHRLVRRRRRRHGRRAAHPLLGAP